MLLQGLDDASGAPWEAAVRDHIRLLVARGTFGDEIVAVGRWWRGDGTDEIDIVALSGRQRTPVLAGEVTWRRRMDGDQLRRGLAVKAAALGGDVSFVVAAREEVRTNDPELVTITADDLFA